jgi:hypothetical protein
LLSSPRLMHSRGRKELPKHQKEAVLRSPVSHEGNWGVIHPKKKSISGMPSCICGSSVALTVCWSNISKLASLVPYIKSEWVRNIHPTHHVSEQTIFLIGPSRCHDRLDPLSFEQVKLPTEIGDCHFLSDRSSIWRNFATGDVLLHAENQFKRAS